VRVPDQVLPELSRDPTHILTAGMLATLAVLLAGTMYSYFALQRAMEHEHAVVATSQRVTTLLSHVSEELAQERAAVLEAITEEPSTYGSLGERLDSDGHGLDEASAELHQLIPEDELSLWHPLAGRVHTFRAQIGLAFELARRGDRTGAEETLDRVAELAPRVFGDLAALTRVHGDRARALVHGTEDRLRMALVISLTASMITSVLMLTIWLMAVRRLRRQRRELDSYTRRIEGANRELDAFAGRVAHDLKNILSPIPIANDLIRAHPGEAVLVERSAQRLQRSFQKAVDVLEGLLTFTRAGDATTDGEVTRVADEALAVLDELQPLVARTGADVQLDVPPDAQVICGASLLHVLLLNLVGNAIKFLDERPVKRVLVRARIEAAQTAISVEDTGPGISEELLERIFEPFYRGPGTTAAGHGIGLATVKRIVQRCGGSVSVSSTVGKGSVFTVVLPRPAPSGPSLSTRAAWRLSQRRSA
jgi:signal transduction histidine kinase